MSVAIVPIAREQSADLHACIDAVAREKRYLAQTFAKPRTDFDAFVRDSVANDMIQYVALDGDRVVGWADIFAGWADAVRHCGGLRGQGIGERLLRACLAKAQAKGITRVELEARADNGRAIRLYQRLGFTHEARKRNAMRFDGVYYDAVQMSILLA